MASTNRIVPNFFLRFQLKTNWLLSSVLKFSAKTFEGISDALAPLPLRFSGIVVRFLKVRMRVADRNRVGVARAAWPLVF
jgi:hypothetical protein